ncbi:MAG: hypothetical protein RIC19_25315 [Phaeodactylibacter sp.]|uniref:hypothetical protein n=1 Tax=Phaeodactylibacter sp. TaxID=1940289 RepID=UPI0032ECCFB9
MTDHYEFILAGKNIVLNAEGFLDNIRIDAEPSDKSMLLKEAYSTLSQSATPNFLLATVHNGQPMLLRKAGLHDKEDTDQALQDFTRTSGTDVLRFTLDEQFQLAHYFYYRAGKLLKSSKGLGSGTEIPYEKMGRTPELVLTAFCDSWLVIQQLKWRCYRLQASLEDA